MAKWIENENNFAINALLSKAADTKNIILSSEILFLALKNYPEKFARFLQGRDYKIICYIREFADLIESCLNQQIKNHYRVDYSNIDNVAASFDYYSCLLKAGNYINDDRFIVKKYASEFFYKGNIYADFMHTLGLELDDSVIYPEKVVNPSLNREALEFRIILNKSFFAKENVDLKYRLNGILAKYSVENHEDSNLKKRYQLLSPMLKDSITLKYAKKESELIAKYFIDSGNSLFNKKQVKYIQYDGLSTEVLSKLLSFIKHHDLKLHKEIIQFTNNELKNNMDRLIILKALNI
ncbi:MAG: hypothetical protein JKX98_06020 [Alcanivoracaceae bacterium]|nr:hypothetical protein [Alcanivoracaceae bacterium]